MLFISPYNVTRTPTNGSAVYWSRDIDEDTWPVYCTTIGGSSGDVICNIRINFTQFYIRCNFHVSR